MESQQHDNPDSIFYIELRKFGRPAAYLDYFTHHKLTVYARTERDARSIFEVISRPLWMMKSWLFSPEYEGTAWIKVTTFPGTIEHFHSIASLNYVRMLFEDLGFERIDALSLPSNLTSRFPVVKEYQDLSPTPG